MGISDALVRKDATRAISGGDFRSQNGTTSVQKKYAAAGKGGFHISDEGARDSGW